MEKKFGSQVPLSNATFELLPLFHTCDLLQGRGYMEESSIITTDVCEVFNEKITYLFYGRPAFKFDTNSRTSRDLSLYPMAFVINASAIKPITRIFPFDSGAMHHERYKDYFNSKMNVLDFEIDANSSRINDIVLHFFGSSEDYLKYNARDINNDVMDFEAHSFREMVRSLSASSADERRATIEVQAPETLKLDASSIKAIILPTAARDSEIVKQFVSANNILVESYDVAIWNPAQCFGLIYNCADKIVKRLGLI